ncbi:MAG: hypothetical protein M1830_003070 [Pleopsidium flavum]|nr:MAG: hypothetical protein M1830_003070 [Pleopsidium flavum]
MSITRSMSKDSRAYSIESVTKPHITFYRKDMSSLKSTRIYKNGRPFNRKYHKFTKLYFTAPRHFRAHGVITEKGESYYVKRDQLELNLNNNIKNIAREIKIIKDNPIIRLSKTVTHPGASIKIDMVKLGACHNAEAKPPAKNDPDVVFVMARPVAHRRRN